MGQYRVLLVIWLPPFCYPDTHGLDISRHGTAGRVVEFHSLPHPDCLCAAAEIYQHVASNFCNSLNREKRPRSEPVDRPEISRDFL